MIQILINFMLIASVLGSIMTVRNLYRTILQIVGASQKIVELLEYEPKIKSTDGEVPDRAEEDIKGEISLKDLKFHYPTKKDVQVLKGVSIDIQKNKVIALVGPSGKQIFKF